MNVHVRSEISRRMLTAIQRHGPQTTQQLAAIGGIPTGRVSCQIRHYVRRGVLAVVAAGRQHHKGRGSVYGPGQAMITGVVDVSAKPKAPARTKPLGRCDCGRPGVKVKWGRPVCERCDRIEREMARRGNHWYYGADYVERERSPDTRYITTYPVAGHVAKHPSLSL